MNNQTPPSKKVFWEIAALVIGLLALIVALLNWLAPFNPIGSSPIILSTVPVADGSLPTVPITVTDQESATSSLTRLALYDSFDDPSLNGTYNTSLWNSGRDSEKLLVYQQNGQMIFQSFAPADFSVIWVEPVKTSAAYLHQYNSIEAEFSWDAEIIMRFYLGITLSSNDLAYTCDFVLVQDSSMFRCGDWRGEQTHRTEDISVTPNRIYRLRIESDLETATFFAYLDGQLIDTYEPTNPDKWLMSSVFYDIHLGTDPESVGKTYIDNVQIGNPTH